MGLSPKTTIRIKGGEVLRVFDRATKDPLTAQTGLLLDILKKNRQTEYGQKHGFSRITAAAAFAATTPITTFSDVAHYVERMKNGERNVLTASQPLMFNLTSGVTAEPKYIPITREGMSLAADTLLQWLCRALRDHPSFLNRSIICVSGAVIEGKTSSGITYGSASGGMYRSLPRVLRGSFALPFVLPEIKNYDLRYYVTARLSLESDPSFLATPNPTTLIKIAETGIRHQEEIIRSIRDGVVARALSFEKNAEDSRVLEIIGARLRPNRSKAGFLERVIHRRGKLLPPACWPKLKLIGCWLGGSIGFHADKLTACFSHGAPIRDIGYLASEGAFTIPFQDNTPAGILALHNNYYEFIPARDNSAGDTRPLLCHELEDGKQYRIILTNRNGLYRYDINDVIEVRGFYNKTPIIAFVRKGEDMVNITGEKFHVNHFIHAFHKLEDAHNLPVTQFRVVPNHKDLRHEILLHLGREASHEFLRDTALPLIDASLSDANIEYDCKRKSKRLNPPCIHVMDASWTDEARKLFWKSGHRDAQYKWRTIAAKLSDVDARHIQRTITMDGETE